MVRVLVVDDDPLVRAGLRLLLDAAPSLAVVGEAADGSEVLGALDRHRPDVVLMDIRMPRLDGIAATRLVRGQPRAPAVLVLTTFDTDADVLPALRAGAAGFLVKDTPPAELVRAIERVAAGDGALSPGVARRLIARTAAEEPQAGRSEAARARLGTLTPRELDVARGIGAGQPNAAIASELHLSVATVKAHVSRLLDKLDVPNRIGIALVVAEAERP